MATLLMFSAPLGEAGVFETMCRVVSGVRVVCVATLLMFSPPSSRGWGARDCVWGSVRPVFGVWVVLVVPLVMCSTPLGGGRGV